MSVIPETFSPPSFDSRLFAEHLVALADDRQRSETLTAWLPLLSPKDADTIAVQLKALADQSRYSDLHRSFQIIHCCVLFAHTTGDPLHLALALRAKGNALGIEQGKFNEALAAYDEAAQIYLQQNLQLEWAQSQIGKIGILARLDRYDEASQIGEQVQAIFESQQHWLLAAQVSSNVATFVYERQGEDRQALRKLDQAARLCQQASDAPPFMIASIAANRGMLLCNLGDFQTSLSTCQRAWQTFNQLGESIPAAHVSQTIGVVLAQCGRYNEALSYLDQVHQVFLAHQRLHDVAETEWMMSDCLLKLRRFAEVLKLCSQARQTYATLGARYEVAQALLNESQAFVGIHDSVQAIRSLHQAREIFNALHNHFWQARSDLYEAFLLYSQQHWQESLVFALRAAQSFASGEYWIEQTQAQLMGARVALAIGQYEQASELLQSAETLVAKQSIPQIVYELYQLQGRLAQRSGTPLLALDHYQKAIRSLEQLQAHLMVEYRSAFMVDKQEIYEEIVALYLAQGQTIQALEFVERAKSRALLELVAKRVDLQIQAKDANDQHLIQALTQLRAEQNRLYRSWEGHQAAHYKRMGAHTEEASALWEEIRAIEQQISDLWNRLLIRNADYANVASLWQVRNEQIQPDLKPNQILLEYFTIHDHLYVFIVNPQEIAVQALPCTMSEIESIMRFLQLNMHVVSQTEEAHPRSQELLEEAQELLQDLYTSLIAPIAHRLQSISQLTVVGHGLLHRLPFHAFYDGAEYLTQKYAINYLPSASLLHYCRRSPDHSQLHNTLHNTEQRHSMLILGHSWHGQLPSAEEEARTVARILGTQAFVGHEATRQRVATYAANATLLHLATHGEFRREDPLYSYLLLEDGRLTALDIFNLRLNASLVTLSACESGQHLVGGGDELFGLLRAFLYAGASSLLVSHWRVDDTATRHMMETFYRYLISGSTKAEALAATQQEWLQHPANNPHPFFWASFFLVGDTEQL